MDEFDVRCPLVTPFREDGSLDVESLADVVEFLTEAGVDGLVPCGTTGEVASLTTDERRRVIAATVEAADGAPVMAGVAGTAVEAVRKRIDDAAAAGADSVLVPPSYYGGQADEAGNEAFFRAVAEETPLPLYLYNVPQAVGQEIAVESVLELAGHDRIAGIKDSSGDVTRFDTLLAETPDDFPVYQGWDPALVPSLAMGADGSVSAMTHLVPDAFDRATSALADGDLAGAREAQLGTIDPAFRACQERDVAPAVKAVLAERGVIDSATVRPPLEPVAADDRSDLVTRVGR